MASKGDLLYVLNIFGRLFTDGNIREEWFGGKFAVGVGVGLAIAVYYFYRWNGREGRGLRRVRVDFEFGHVGGQSLAQQRRIRDFSLQGAPQRLRSAAGSFLPGLKRKESRRYGYFQCTGCGKRWESSCAFSKGSSRNDWYTQDCQRCGTPTKPYGYEPLVCRDCHQTNCICDKAGKRERHNNPIKPHQRNLCERCRLGRPCVDARQSRRF